MRDVAEPFPPRKGPQQRRMAPPCSPSLRLSVHKPQWHLLEAREARERRRRQAREEEPRRTPSSFCAFSASKLDGMPPLPPATPSPPVEPEPLMRLSISLAALAAMMKLVEEEAVRGEVESGEGRVAGVEACALKAVGCRCAGVERRRWVRGEGRGGTESRRKQGEGQLVSLGLRAARSTPPSSIHTLQRLSLPSAHLHEPPSRIPDDGPAEKR